MDSYYTTLCGMFSMPFDLGLGLFVLKNRGMSTLQGFDDLHHCCNLEFSPKTKLCPKTSNNKNGPLPRIDQIAI